MTTRGWIGVALLVLDLVGLVVGGYVVVGLRA